VQIFVDENGQGLRETSTGIDVRLTPEEQSAATCNRD